MCPRYPPRSVLTLFLTPQLDGSDHREQSESVCHSTHMHEVPTMCQALHWADAEIRRRAQWDKDPALMELISLAGKSGGPQRDTSAGTAE